MIYHNARKFSAVLGVLSENNSKTIRPAVVVVSFNGSCGETRTFLSGDSNVKEDYHVNKHSTSDIMNYLLDA